MVAYAQEPEAVLRYYIVRPDVFEIYWQRADAIPDPQPRPGVRVSALSDEQLELLPPAFAIQTERFHRLGFNTAYGVCVDGVLTRYAFDNRRCRQASHHKMLKLRDGEAEIAHCLTAPDSRGQGVCGIAIRSLAAIARSKGIRDIFMIVVSGNEASAKGIRAAGLISRARSVRFSAHAKVGWACVRVERTTIRSYGDHDRVLLMPGRSGPHSRRRQQRPCWIGRRSQPGPGPCTRCSIWTSTPGPASRSKYHLSPLSAPGDGTGRSRGTAHQRSIPGSDLVPSCSLPRTTFLNPCPPTVTGLKSHFLTGTACRRRLCGHVGQTKPMARLPSGPESIVRRPCIRKRRPTWIEPRR